MTATYVPSRMRDISGLSVNVCDYGAVGNGATDDTAAINAAIAAAAGGAVYLPRGTYLQTSVIRIAAAGTALHFAPGAILTPNFRTISGGYLTVVASDVSILNPSIAGVGSAYGDGALTIGGVSIGDATGGLASVKRCRVLGGHISDISGHGIITQQEAADCVILGNVIERVGSTAGDPDGHGIVLTGPGHVCAENIIRDGRVRGIEAFGTAQIPTHSLTVVGNSISGCGQDAVTVKDVSESAITGNACRANGRHGIYCGLGSTVGIINVAIGDNVCYGNANEGVHIEGLSRRVAISGNVLAENGGIGIYLGTGGAGEYPTGCTISANIAHRNHQHGVSLETAIDTAVTGNVVTENGYGQGANSYWGIRVVGGSLRTVITGNRCGDAQAIKTQEYGIACAGLSDYSLVMGNNCVGNGNASEDIYVTNSGNSKSVCNLGRYAVVGGL